jgi:hypothetical protein
MSTPSTTPFVGSIAWASHSGGSPPRVEDPGYLPEVVAFAAQLAARRYRLGRAGLARLNQAAGGLRAAGADVVPESQEDETKEARSSDQSDRLSRWVELRGLEPLTFSLRRLLLLGWSESATLRGVAGGASRVIVAVVRSTQGVHCLPL